MATLTDVVYNIHASLHSKLTNERVTKAASKLPDNTVYVSCLQYYYHVTGYVAYR